MTDWQDIAACISAATGRPFQVRQQRTMGGGCINRALVLSDGEQSCFVKLNDAARVDMFEAEFLGLQELASARAIRVPRPICYGVSGAESFLVMERLELGGRLDAHRAGQQLALLHQRTAGQFGWHRDNTIGSTPQHNSTTGDWISFWRDQRLAPQLALAARNGHGGKLQSNGERLLENLAPLLPHSPRPSLLHGDLWGGNIGAMHDGTPVIFDPATYYGDRETDLAMTELFGGFPAGFHAAYAATWPLPAGHETRKILYNLYHVLNHLNLFGGGYLVQAERMIQALLAQLR